MDKVKGESMTDQEMKQKEIFLEETEKSFELVMRELQKQEKPLKKGTIIVVAETEEDCGAGARLFAASIFSSNCLVLFRSLMAFISNRLDSLPPAARKRVLDGSGEISEKFRLDL